MAAARMMEGTGSNIGAFGVVYPYQQQFHRPPKRRRIVGGILERYNPGEREQEKLQNSTPLWKDSESILRSYIRHHFLPRNDSECSSSNNDNDTTAIPTIPASKKQQGPHHGEVHPDDALHYLAILIETKLLDPNDLATIELQPFVHPYCRSNRITVWQQKITRIRLGYPGCGSWDFCQHHVWDLLGKLKCLRALQLEGCASLCVLETTSRLPNILSLSVECQTRHGITAAPPRRLKDDADDVHPNNQDGSTKKPPPPHPLETLCLNSCLLEDQEDLEKWLLDVVLPYYPNLGVLRFGSNQLDSLKRIAQRLQQDDALRALATKHSLQTLDLGRWIPKHERLPPPKRARRGNATNTEEYLPRNEAEAMQVLFSAFPQLKIVRGTCDTLTEVYCVSRALVVETKRKTPLPLSLWPIALETCWKRGFGFVPQWESFRSSRTKPSPDGIYHLLKHVLAEKEKKQSQHHQKAPSGSNPQPPQNELSWKDHSNITKKAFPILACPPNISAAVVASNLTTNTSLPKNIKHADGMIIQDFREVLASLDKGFFD